MTAARRADVFRIGGDLPVSRVGFGALRILGHELWGEPPDRTHALKVLQTAVGLGANLIDTADSYGPETSEQLIREALSPYAADLVIATKGGYVRPYPNRWVELGRPEYLIQSAKLSARRLGVDQIQLWQLHRIDPKVPRDEQFDAIRTLRAEGVIRHAGLSEVGVEDIEAAERYFPVASVQNNFSVGYRRYEPVLEHCEARGIAFLAFFPLGRGALARDGSPLAVVAERYGVTSAQIALAWLLRRSPALLPIPGTASLEHLRDNLAATHVALSAQDFHRLSQEIDGRGDR